MRRIPTSLLALFLASPLIGYDFESEPTDLQPVEGLTIRSYANDGMAGTYTVDGATIDFTIEREGTACSALISDAEGAPLLESIAESGHEVVTLLGGRAVLSSDLTGATDAEGPQAVQEELIARPEGPCIAGLRDALERAGVDPVLLGAEAALDEVTPNLWIDGSWRHLGQGESMIFGTWGWWSYANLVVHIRETS